MPPLRGAGAGRPASRARGKERGGAVVLAGLLVLAGCRAPEPIGAARARAQQRLIESELTELGRLIQKARRGEMVTDGQIAIGVSEALIERLLSASLPPERVLAGRLRIRVERIVPLFRGGRAFIVFRTRIGSIDVPNASAEVELRGGLKQLRLVNGHFSARVSLLSFHVVRSFAGDLGKKVIEDAVHANLSALEAWVPPLEIPVFLQEGLEFAGLREGPVRVGPGRLPLTLALSHVIAIDEHLWLLVQGEVGEWESGPAPGGPR